MNKEKGHSLKGIEFDFLFVDGTVGVLFTKHGPIEVTHGHSYYWCVKGLVPRDLAVKMHESFWGEKIRVAGHCAAPHPDKWLTWIANGKKVLATNSLDIPDELKERPEIKKLFRESLFSDNPQADFDARAFVDSYHIDGTDALMYFVQEIKKSR